MENVPTLTIFFSGQHGTRVSGLSNAETSIGEDEFNGTMLVEWSKARARMQRWNEELLIVQEEMR